MLQALGGPRHFEDEIFCKLLPRKLEVYIYS